MSLQDEVRHLASNPTLRAIEPEALRLIAFAAEPRAFRPGDVLFTAGEPSDCGYLLLTGAVALETDEGAAVRVGPPTLIGDAALLAETERPCTAVVMEPTTVLKITRALFHRVLSEHPNSAVRLRQALAQRLLAFCDDLKAYRRDPLD